MALLAGGLIITWVYHLYDKNQYSHKQNEILVRDSSAVVKAVADSLREFFTHTLNQLNSEKIEIDSASSSLNGELEQKINEINTLKTEIGNILKRKTLTHDDLRETQLKIDSLSNKLVRVKNENKALIEKRNRLNDVATQLSNDVRSQTPDNTKTNEDRKMVSTPGPVFTTSAIKFAAYTGEPEKYTETTLHESAKKFEASFIVKNNLISLKMLRSL